MDEDNPATNTQEPDEYRPEIIDHSVLQQIEGAEVTTQIPTPIQTLSAMPVAQVQTPVIAPAAQPVVTATPQKPHRGLKISLLAIAALLIVSAIGLAVFYFVIRTPNSEYDAALQNLQTMKTSGEAVRDMKIDGEAAKNYKQTAQYNSVREYAATYTGALTRLKASPVMKKDMSVKLALAENKAIIEPYGQSTLDMTDTLATFQEVDVTCRKDLNKGISYQTTKKIIDETFSDCAKLLKENPTVPTNPFNDDYYVKYVAAVKEIISDAYAYAAALDTGEPGEKLRAIEAIQMSSIKFSHLGDNTVAPNIANTAQPSAKIADVIKTVQQRKDVFFRW